jgi:hypothetical protein
MAAIRCVKIQSGYCFIRKLHMPYTVGFDTLSAEGLESSPVAEALAGLRANEARYYKNKYNYDFTVNDASDDKDTVEYVHAFRSTGKNTGKFSLYGRR